MLKRLTRKFFTLFVLVAALAVVSSAPDSTTRTAKALDPCDECNGKVGALYNACADLYGETAYCGDIYNDGVVFCYATVCEQ